MPNYFILAFLILLTSQYTFAQNGIAPKNFFTVTQTEKGTTNTASTSNPYEGSVLTFVLPICNVRLKTYFDYKSHPLQRRKKRRIRPVESCVAPLLSIAELYLALPLEQSHEAIASTVRQLRNETLSAEEIQHSAYIRRQLTSSELITFRRLAANIQNVDPRYTNEHFLIIIASAAVRYARRANNLQSVSESVSIPERNPNINLDAYTTDNNGIVVRNGTVYTVSTVVFTNDDPASLISENVNTLTQIIREWQTEIRDSIPNLGGTLEHALEYARTQNIIMNNINTSRIQDSLYDLLGNHGPSRIVYAILSYEGTPMVMMSARISSEGFFTLWGPIYNYVRLHPTHNGVRHFAIFDYVYPVMTQEALRQGGVTLLEYSD